MDSMRSLNNSLPNPRRNATQPSESLLQSFKSAALSVTNLYKTAAADRASAYNEGYQDALEELLSFLDRENLGVGDGEGWAVRQWATERFQNGEIGALSGQNTTTSVAESEGDEEAEEESKRARSSSPVMQAKHNNDIPPTSRKPTTSASQDPQTTTTRCESAPPVPQTAHSTPSFQPTNWQAAPQATFTFASPYPDMDFEASSTPTNNANTATSTSAANGPTQTTTAPVRLDIVPRHSHNSRTRHSSRSSARAPLNLGSLGAGGAGMKRRMPFGDFFDITGLGGNARERDGGGGGGGKRGRYL